MVSKSRILRKTNDKANKETKIMEFTGKLLEVKLSNTIPPMIQYHILETNPKLNDSSRIYIKIKFGLKRIFKLGTKITEIRITKRKATKEGIFMD